MVLKDKLGQTVRLDFLTSERNRTGGGSGSDIHAAGRRGCDRHSDCHEPAACCGGSSAFVLVALAIVRVPGAGARTCRARSTSTTRSATSSVTAALALYFAGLVPRRALVEDLRRSCCCSASASSSRSTSCTSGREADPRDVLANSIGALLGLLLARLGLARWPELGRVVVRAAGGADELARGAGESGRPAGFPARRRRPTMRCARWPIACARARSTNSSGRSRCSGAGKPLRQALEQGPAAFADPLGPAGHRQDHARAAHRAPRRCGVHAALRRHGRRQGHSRGRRAGAHGARRTRPPQRAVPRRGASLQQGAAGHVPAVRRGRHADLHRRDHRESLVRSHQRAAVARTRVRAAFARRRRHRQTTASRAGGFRARARPARPSTSTTRRWSRWRMPATAMRAARSACSRSRRISRSRTATVATITLEQVREVATGGRRRFDKGGEQFYDQISALAQGGARHRSGRARCTGSRACSMAAAILTTSRGASCAWRSRTSGSPIRAVQQIALDAWQTFERLGSPEGELALANARGVSRGRAEEQRGLRGLWRSAAPTSSSSARSTCRCVSAMRRRSS